MPQLNIADFMPQLVWLAITFGALYFIMARVALPKIGGMIELRHGRIADDLAEARRLKADTEKAIAAYETALGEARAKAHAIAQENREILNAEMAAEAAALDAKLAEKTGAAEARIAETKAQALAQVQSVAADTANEIVKRLTGAGAPGKDVAAAVANAMKS